jgi:hypothetical protein
MSSGKDDMDINVTNDCVQFFGIKSEVIVQDAQLIKDRPILIEQSLRQEGEVLSVPCVHGITSTEGDTGREYLYQ